MAAKCFWGRKNWLPIVLGVKRSGGQMCWGYKELAAKCFGGKKNWRPNVLGLKRIGGQMFWG